MWKVCNCAIIASNCKASQKVTKKWFQDLWAGLSRYIDPPLDKGNILSFGDNLSGGLIKKPTPIQFLK